MRGYMANHYRRQGCVHELTAASMRFIGLPAAQGADGAGRRRQRTLAEVAGRRQKDNGSETNFWQRAEARDGERRRRERTKAIKVRARPGEMERMVVVGKAPR